MAKADEAAFKESTSKLISEIHERESNQADYKEITKSAQSHTKAASRESNGKEVSDQSDSKDRITKAEEDDEAASSGKKLSKLLESESDQADGEEKITKAEGKKLPEFFESESDQPEMTKKADEDASGKWRGKKYAELDESESDQSDNEEGEKTNTDGDIQTKIGNRQKEIAKEQDDVIKAFEELVMKIDDKDRETANRYRPLVNALIENNVNAVSDFVNKNLNSLLVDRINLYGETIFDYILNVAGMDKVIKKLVLQASKESLNRAGLAGMTALQAAAEIGNSKAVKLIIEKYGDLLVDKDGDGWLPIDYAIAMGSGDRETIECLLSAHAKRSPSFDVGFLADCAGVLLRLIQVNHIDLASDFLHKYSMLANRNVNKLWKKTLKALAKKDTGLPNRTWQCFIYQYIPMNVIKLGRKSDSGDVENQISTTQRANYLARINQKLWSTLLPLVPGIKSTYDRKLTHEQIFEMIKIMMAEGAWNPDEAYRLLRKPMLIAAKYGNYGLVDEISKACEFSYLFTDEHGHTPLHIAVLHRQPNVFNLINKPNSILKERIKKMRDDTYGNILHLAAKLVPSDKIPGAALKMQREMQWYKTVEDTFHPSLRLRRNFYGKTSREVFTEEHEKLLKEGEKWMKETATACSVVAALIITVIFSTAYTFPGGIDDRGIPKFLPKVAFKVFLVSIALALFTSTASVLMFMGILTSRYAEQDFLESLPQKLIFGLVTLFFSIGSMMAAFASTFYIYIQERVWVTSIMVIFVFLVVILFGIMQFPLFIDIFKSTYGVGIFRRLR